MSQYCSGCGQHFSKCNEQCEGVEIEEKRRRDFISDRDKTPTGEEAESIDFLKRRGYTVTRASTPTPDLGVAVEALQWSKKRIEYLQLMLGDRHDCEIRYIDEALKSLGGE